MAFSGNWLRRRSARNAAASEAYRRLLNEALQPVHYLEHGVFDTFEGRAGMVTALTSLVCERLSQIPGEDAAGLIRRLNDRVLDGFDAAFREKGVGDASIARKVRALAQVHAGMGKALFAELSAPAEVGPEAGLAAILARNGVVSSQAPLALARWLLGCAAHLRRQADAEILHGRIEWVSG